MFGSLERIGIRGTSDVCSLEMIGISGNLRCLATK